mmetsp:Transcript_24310/g.49255  ORF Transcript_24310/g.49255 Transcript_24310/m.49255 type:complete len:295 (-) Transcript_24310:218-1102(-)
MLQVTDMAMGCINELALPFCLGLSQIINFRLGQCCHRSIYFITRTRSLILPKFSPVVLNVGIKLAGNLLCPVHNADETPDSSNARPLLKCTNMKSWRRLVVRRKRAQVCACPGLLGGVLPRGAEAAFAVDVFVPLAPHFANCSWRGTQPPARSLHHTEASFAASFTIAFVPGNIIPSTVRSTFAWSHRAITWHHSFLTANGEDRTTEGTWWRVEGQIESGNSWETCSNWEFDRSFGQFASGDVPNPSFRGTIGMYCTACSKSWALAFDKVECPGKNMRLANSRIASIDLCDNPF